MNTVVQSSNITFPKPPLLQIDCVKYNLVGEQCANYIAMYIQSYAGYVQTPSETYDVPSQGYNSFTVPQDTIFFPMEYFHLNETGIKKYGLRPTTTVTTLQVQCYLEFSKLYGIDDVASTLATNVIFTLLWFDYRLAWNKSLTPINYDYIEQDSNEEASIYLDTQTISISSEWIWKPAFALLNSASNDDFLSHLTGIDRLEIYPSGLVKWRLKGNAETTCTLNLRMFPFDVQTCTLQFSSRAKQLIDGLNFSIVHSNATVDESLGSLTFPDSNSVLAISYESSASWRTVSSSAIREEQILIGDQFRNTQSVLVYSLTIARYSRFYISTGIIPNILVSLLALVSLWVTDYAARLGVSITAMLTIIAIMWSVTSNLPVTSTITWMDYFLNFCIILVTLITIETCIVLHISSKKSIVPQWKWLRLYVNFCSWQYMLYLFHSCSSICGDFWCDCYEISAAVNSGSNSGSSSGGNSNHTINKNTNMNHNHSSSMTTSKSSNSHHHHHQRVLSLSREGDELQHHENPSFNHSSNNHSHHNNHHHQKGGGTAGVHKSNSSPLNYQPTEIESKNDTSNNNNNGNNTDNRDYEKGNSGDEDEKDDHKNNVIKNVEGMKIDYDNDNNTNNNHRHAINVKHVNGTTLFQNNNNHNHNNTNCLHHSEENEEEQSGLMVYDENGNKMKNSSNSKLMRFITWKRLARAIDFCSQLIFVIAYIVAFSILFSRPQVL